MSTVNINIGKKTIGEGFPCFIIAEAGVNHNGSLSMALQLVEAARDAGADAVKFQLFDADEQLSGESVPAAYQQEATGHQSMREMAASYDLPWEAHREIARRCQESGILYMASCFDPRAVDFLLDMGGDCIKVGSGEITNYPLLAYMAGKGKPVLLSTGMSTLQDIAGAVQTLQDNGNPPLALFHCTSAYPAEPETVNLRVMQALAHAFHLPVGFSDHTMGDAVPLAAVALGARMLEKHFTLDRNLPGPDHTMSLDPPGLKNLVERVRAVELSLGDGIKKVHPAELPFQRAARRSLVSTAPIGVGEALNEKNVAIKRPGTGIDPRLWPYIRGRKAAVAIPADALITWEMLA